MKRIWPVVMRCWCGYLSGAWCRVLAYGPADATASPVVVVVVVVVHLSVTVKD